MSATRDAVLARIRAALSDGEAQPAVPRDYRTSGSRPADEVLALFVERVEETGAVVVRTAEAGSAVTAAVASRDVTRIVVPGDLPMALRPAGVRVLEDDRMSPVELDGLDGVVTTCAAACAETGTIAFDGGDGQGRRAVTLVPDLHVCVVRTGQVVETVPELFERLAPSAREGRPIVLVSGPSATSDIEFERVEGVHGPRHLVVVLLEEDGRARP